MTSVPPKKATAFSFPITFMAAAGGAVQATPTLASGDVKVSKDFGAFSNIGTLPTEIANGVCEVELTGTEMDADVVIVQFLDAAGDEWLPMTASIHTAAQTLDEIKAETAAILLDTAEIGAAGAGLTEAGGTGDQFTAIPWNASWDTEVQSEVEDGLAAYDPPTKAELDAAVSGLSTLDAAGVRTAVGLASANLDTQLDALPTANENADALLDRSNGVETGWTLRQVLRLISAVLVGKASVSSISAVFRDLNDTKDRVTATVDSVGSRSSVTKDAS